MEKKIFAEIFRKKNIIPCIKFFLNLTKKLRSDLKNKISRNIMDPDSSNSSGEGNTKTSPSLKQITPSKRWCFTLNNYSDDDIDRLVPILNEYCSKYIVGKEVGEQGTPHLQGFFEFKTKRRPVNLFNNKKIHFEKTRGGDIDNVVYCSKEGSVILNFNMPKIPRPLKLIEPNRGFQQEILEILKGDPCDRKIFWYYGDGGCGKTQFCKYLSAKHDAICLSGKGSDVRNGVVEYIKKNGNTPEIVIFPIPKSYNKEYVSYEALENIKDMYFYSGKYEGGMVNGNSPHLIVFANEPPQKDKLSSDRWEIYEIQYDYTTIRV